MKVTRLRTNRMENPLGFWMEEIRLSCIVEEAVGKQAAAVRYQVSETDAFGAPVYDSGELAGQENLVCFVLPLEVKPRTRYHWRAWVRTDAGEEYTYREAWELPEGLGTAVWITISSLECPGWLKLIPKAVIVGLGCRKDIPFQNLNQAVDQMLADYHVSDQAVLGIATIDRKAREPAVLELIKKRNWNLFAYTAEELEAVPGVFSESEFVRKTVGTGNVCQRAALLSGGLLLAEKTRFPGITMALALCEHVPDGRKSGDKKETDP